jgi:hypothetical protein
MEAQIEMFSSKNVETITQPLKKRKWILLPQIIFTHFIMPVNSSTICNELLKIANGIMFVEKFMF